MLASKVLFFLHLLAYLRGDVDSKVKALYILLCLQWYVVTESSFPIAMV